MALFKAPGRRHGCVAKVAVSSGLARPYCLYLSLYGTKGTWERNRLQAPGADTSEDYLFLRKIPNLREMVKLSTPRSRYHHFAGLNAELGAGSTAGALPGMEEMMRAFGTQGHGAHDAMPAPTSSPPSWRTDRR